MKIALLVQASKAAGRILTQPGKALNLFSNLKFISNHPLNRGQRASAILRFMRWQIGSRLVSRPMILEWVNGAKMVVRRGEAGATQNLYCGLHDFADMAYLLHVLTPDDIFVDIGSNVGSYTILACASKGASGYCFEPVPETYIRLQENIALNSIGARVTALNIGVSDSDGELFFTSDENCTNHVSYGEPKESMRVVKVRVCALDSILAKQSPTMMKLDVEGFETSVIRGAGQILENPSLHSVIMELNGSGARYGFDETKILSMMTSNLGFSTYQYEPFSRQLVTLQGKNSNYGNTLFVRDAGMIRERLKNAPPVNIHQKEF